MSMLIAQSKEWKREYGYTYPHVDETKPKVEIVEDNSCSVDVFKQWVTATGGKTV